eukprot:353478-Chlamydomonas_euryale.AAC.5
MARCGRRRPTPPPAGRGRRCGSLASPALAAAAAAREAAKERSRMQMVETEEARSGGVSCCPSARERLRCHATLPAPLRRRRRRRRRMERGGRALLLLRVVVAGRRYLGVTVTATGGPIGQPHFRDGARCGGGETRTTMAGRAEHACMQVWACWCGHPSPAGHTYGSPKKAPRFDTLLVSISPVMPA